MRALATSRTAAVMLTSGLLGVHRSQSSAWQAQDYQLLVLRRRVPSALLRDPQIIGSRTVWCSMADHFCTRTGTFNGGELVQRPHCGPEGFGLSHLWLGDDSGTAA